MDELSSPATMKAAAAELVATALFIFIGVGSIAAFIAAAGEGTALVDGVPIIALAFGFAIALLAAGIGGISGGHINPAVTFAMIIAGRMSVAKGGAYIVAQLIGACLGALLLRLFITEDVLGSIPGAGGNAINPDVVASTLAGLGIEITGTFILVWTVFAVAVTPRGNSGIVAPLFIGLAVLVVHLVLVPLTGAGINPARTLGPALLLPGVADDVAGRWEDIWVFLVGPLIGAALAALSYSYLYLKGDEEAPAQS